MKNFEKMSREDLVMELNKRDKASPATCRRAAIDEVIDRDDPVLFPPADIEVVKDGYRKAMPAVKTMTCEETFNCAAGRIDFLSGKGPLYDERGAFSGLSGMADDIARVKLSDDSLRKSGELLRSMFEGSMDAIFLASPDGRIHSANPAACAVYGMTEEEIRAIGRDGLVVRDSLLLDAIERRKRTGKFRGEINCIRKDGTVFPVEVSSSVFIDADGLEKTIMIHRDITGRKEMEKTLLESEKRYRSLFGNMQEGFSYCRMLYDADGIPVDFVYLDVNRAFERLTGLENVIGRKVSEVIPEIRELHPELFEIYGRVALTGRPEKFEIKLKRLQAWLSLSVYSTEKGYFVVVFENINERKKAEHSLRESEERWQLAIEGSSSGVWDWNVESGEAFYSDGLKELLGYDGREGGNWVDEWVSRTHPEDKERVMDEVGRFLAGESKLISMEHRVRCGSGTFKWVMERGRVISRTPEGKPLRIVGVITDITERKELEEQLYQAQKMESVGQLAGGVAHEFNNILTAVVGFAQLLEIKIPAEDPLQKYVNQIQNCVERASKLTQGLLCFSRTRKLSPRVVDLNEVVKEQEMMLRTLVRAQTELRLDMAKEKLPVCIDCIKIGQVIMNLVSNAKDALSGAGVISVSTSLETMNSVFMHAHGFGAPGSYGCISVSDTGCGMNVETGKRIFEPFFTTKEVGKGTGLGLSVAYGIIKQHKGCISVLSEPGNGTTFRIYLPIAEEEYLHPGGRM